MANYRKRAISLPPEVDAAVEVAATGAGQSISAWLTEAARRRLRREAGLAAVREWEAEQGPLSPEERAAARAELANLRAGGPRAELIVPAVETALAAARAEPQPVVDLVAALEASLEAAKAKTAEPGARQPRPRVQRRSAS